MKLTKANMRMFGLTGGERAKGLLSYLHVKGKVLEASDGFALVQQRIEEGQGLEDGALIPAHRAKAIKAMQEAGLDVPEDWTCSDGGDMGAYPDTDGVWPKGRPVITVYFNMGRLIGLARAMDVARKTDGMVRLSLYKGVTPIVLEKQGGAARGLLMPMREG